MRLVLLDLKVLSGSCKDAGSCVLVYFELRSKEHGTPRVVDVRKPGGFGLRACGAEVQLMAHGGLVSQAMLSLGFGFGWFPRSKNHLRYFWSSARGSRFF